MKRVISVYIYFIPILAFDCGQPPTVPHSAVDVTSTIVNSSATYSCSPGYVLSPSSTNGTKTCNETGSWAGSDIVCNGKSTFFCLRIQDEWYWQLILSQSTHSYNQYQE